MGEISSINAFFSFYSSRIEQADTVILAEAQIATNQAKLFSLMWQIFAMSAGCSSLVVSANHKQSVYLLLRLLNIPCKFHNISTKINRWKTNSWETSRWETRKLLTSKLAMRKLGKTCK